MERRAMVIHEHPFQPIINRMTMNLEQKIQRMTRIESFEENLLKKDEVKNKTKKFLNKK
ncbi:hypothetical protein KFV05_07870 [Macrococcoides canis]|uniref:hypothetical protein n=1 Tax=Macrococcoides canis TaxID=1855823 RepID=UPI0020B6EC29|nr:hypothetical protein [Macrococcus canis]UTH01634.1 hypothetical protein KFV05_07870 [Macrococcus canis]